MSIRFTGARRSATGAAPAVVTPAVSGAKFEWGDGGGAYTAASKTATLTVTGAEGKVGDAEAEVECTIDDQKATAKHAFRIYELALKHADGVSAPKLRFLKQKQRGYKAVLNPPLDRGNYVWNPGGKMLSIGKGKNVQSPVQVLGAAATEATKLGVKYTLDDQSHQLSVDLMVVDVSVTPDVQGEAVDRTNGSTVELTAVGAPDESGHKWELGANDFSAAVDGASDQKKLKVKAKKPGEVKAKLTYTLDGDKQECEGTAFFVEERIKSLKPENRAMKNIAEAAPETDKIVEVLLGIANDPAVWETGNVDAEAEGKPAKLAKTKEDGTHEWTPPTDRLVRAAATQPDDNHATDKSKLLLRALPTSANAGPPTGNPGYQDDEVEVKYTLHSVESEDKFKVRVHRYGCSQIHWVRKGKTGGTAVDLNDRPVICTHRGTPQWNSIVNATPPPGGTEVGVVDILDPGGHQHGARCFVCSGAANASTAASPRHVWHWIPVTPRVLAAARGLANSVGTFARDYTQSGGPNSAWLTDELWNYLRPWVTTPTGGYNANKSKMLGVLVGQNSTGGDVWLTALSGFWAPTTAWLAPININETTTTRTIPSAQGAGTVYTKTQAPFNTTAMTDGWGKLGRCAATALLGTALARGLKNLELAEVWLDVSPTLSATATFQHTHEIGSCEQCRRYLGRMLCEVGT